MRGMFYGAPEPRFDLRVVAIVDRRQETLCHANISETMNTYSHVLPGMGNAAAGAMDEALG